MGEELPVPTGYEVGWAQSRSGRYRHTLTPNRRLSSSYSVAIPHALPRLLQGRYWVKSSLNVRRSRGPCSGIQHRASRWKPTDYSEEHAAFNIKVEELAKEGPAVLAGGKTISNCQLVSCLDLILRPWRWRGDVSPTLRLVFDGLYPTRHNSKTTNVIT
jgi:hypothetical protein